MTGTNPTDAERLAEEWKTVLRTWFGTPCGKVLPGETYYEIHAAFDKVTKSYDATITTLRAERDAARANSDARIFAFTRAILHGDADYQHWLVDAAEAFVMGNPVPPIRVSPPTTDDVTGQPRSEWAAVNVAREQKKEAAAEMMSKLEQHVAATTDDVERCNWIGGNDGSWCTTCKQEHVQNECQPSCPYKTDDVEQARLLLLAVEDELDKPQGNAVALLTAALTAAREQGRTEMREEAAKVADQLADDKGSLRLGHSCGGYCQKIARDIRALPITAPFDQGDKK